MAARVLAGHGFRLRRPVGAEADPPTAPLGVGREGLPAGRSGNLLFHLALLGVLVSVALGGLFGYKADRLLVQGDTFADTASALDEFHPGRLVTAADLGPFTITLNKFDATLHHLRRAARAAAPRSTRRSATPPSPAGRSAPTTLQVNRPLSVDGAKVYLIGHGYAPVFRVTDARGQVVYNAATPFISGATGNFLSEGVVKVPDAQPEQLGFTGVFVPTAVDVNGTLESAFPAADNPVVSLIAYAGNLGMNTGAAAVGLPAGHQRNAAADGQPAGAGCRASR